MMKWKPAGLGAAAAGIACMVWAGTAAGATGDQFMDLKGAQWAADSITYMAKRGTVAGYGNGIFKPEGAVTRAQAVTFMVRELYPQQLADSDQTYTDVPRSHPFYKEISVAARMGLAGGFPDGSFHPDAPVSRAETAAFLTRAYALQSGERAVSLSDTATHWAAAPIGVMSSNGLIGGYADGAYRPDKSVTRAEFAVFMTRVIRFERANAIQAQDWDKLMSYMTVSEQVGQMLMPDIREWKGQPTRTLNEGIKATIHDQDLGGFILFEKNIANAEQVTTLTHGLQAEAGDIPLFLGIDQEGGVIKRIPGGTNLPGQMALGAARDTSLAEAAGKLTGEELKALGMQLDFAPVLDINSNPDNPIIGMRSFSSDPDLVTRLGLAEIKGLQSSGVIPAVKHFPGHGDTTVDSHLGLPVLTHDRARLDAVELKPFRAAIEAGVDMIMSAHIAFPAVDNEHVTSRKDGSSVPVPATLSKKVLTGLLRDELDFKGVIISDAFTMNGIAEHFGEEQAVVRAVSAGIDIILMPKDSAIAHQALVEAVHNGTLSTEAIHASVKRILQLKAKYGLFGERDERLSSKLAALPAIIGATPHRKVEQEIAEHAVTLLTGRDGKYPDRIGQGDRVVIAAADDEIGKQLAKQLREAGASQQLSIEIVIIGPGKTAEALRKLKDANYVVLASYQFRNVASQFGWSDYQTVIDEVNKLGKRYSLVSLGNPYELLYLRDVKSGMALYGKQEPNIKAGMNVLLGQAELPGVLPVQN
ncbi:glycoside hydrolase family 3 N-terminal domain-containing protein [Paenibacillus sp. CF384]|uniref:glycoside hydrolase family 3 N-terminal domain-containing protein n=1 Tax=Paenibacillus sp. CF384 TaxID=1884382 RepID=UPI00089920D7|nr:glycoside hydrolase family 3 N-terminal domain-containing protein [Paenibacillus sp. CF384]SDX57206.1 beta-N-acetylhexosaminidase [Paenibacillus sp. CF384]